MYKSPTNIASYWAIVDTYWDDINHIINIYLPTFSDKWIDGTKLDKPLGEYIIELKEAKNPRLVRAFNAAWWNCPEESAGEWNHKSWNVLCDLCSEEWCLYEEKEVE
jgi:hypothetical protein